MISDLVVFSSRLRTASLSAIGIANMFALPIADKLAVRSREEKTSKTLIIDALLSIQSGQNPRIIASMLEAYLPRSKRTEEEDMG